MRMLTPPIAMAYSASAASASASALDLLAAAGSAAPAATPGVLSDSTELYTRCIAHDDWRPLAATLETEGYLCLRGVLLRDELQPTHALAQAAAQRPAAGGQLLNNKSSALLPSQLSQQLSSIESTNQARTWETVTQSPAVHNLLHSPALHRVLGRLNVHGGRHFALADCAWIHTRAPGAAETVPCTDYLHFRHRSPAVFGKPFHPRWSLDAASLCPQVQVKSPCTRTLAAHADLFSRRNLQNSHRVSSLCTVHSVLFPQDLAHHPSCESCSDVALDHYTCWIPLHDLSSLDSRLELLPGSHEHKGSIGLSASQLPADTAAALGSKAAPSWCAASNIRAGDVIIYNWRTAHRFSSSPQAQHPSCSMILCVKLNEFAQYNTHSSSSLS
jgi:hypothetical protein